MINWIPVMYSLPESDKPVLVVSDDLTMRSMGKPSTYVDVAFYEKETDSFTSLTDDLSFRTQVFFWAELPDVPHALMHNVLSAGGN